MRPGRALGAAIAVLIALVGCRDAPDEARPAQRLELRAVGVSPSPPEALELLRFEDFDAEEGFDRWEIQGGRASVAEVGGERRLVIQRDQNLAITIPVELEPSRAGEVEITYTCNDMMAFRVEWHSEGRTVGRVVTPHSHPNEASRTAIMRYPRVKRAHGTIDLLQIEMPEGEVPLVVHSIVVRHLPPARFLPEEATGGVCLVGLDADARRATNLFRDRPLSTAFEHELESARLAFSYALPHAARFRSTEPVLRVDLESEDGAQKTHRLPLEADLRVESEWHEAALAIPGALGGSVTATFTFEGSENDGALCLLGEPLLCSPQPEPETVLLITSDTHRADHLGFLGIADGLSTPNLDRLASEGVSFLNAYASINCTTPSHVSMMTGTSPRDTGLVTNDRRISELAPTLAECFRDQGYVCLAAVSAAPVNYVYSGLGQGFDRFSFPHLVSQRDSTEAIADLTGWLPDYEGQRLFVWLHIYDAHGPYDPPDEYKQLYYPRDRDPFDAAAQDAAPELAPLWNQKIADPSYTEALYKSEITYLDERLGAFIAHARFERAVIALTADHGETMRRGISPFEHLELSPSTLAVPLLFRGPGLVPGTRVEHPVMLEDLGRSILDLAGLEDAPFPGKNLLSDYLERDRPGLPRYALEDSGQGASVQLGKWMLLLTLHVASSDQERYDELYHATYLYDIEQDPCVENDLAAAEPEVTARLRKQLIRWLREADDQDWQKAGGGSADQRRSELADLGYTIDGGTAIGDDWIDPECECSWCLRFR